MKKKRTLLCLTNQKRPKILGNPDNQSVLWINSYTLLAYDVRVLLVLFSSGNFIKRSYSPKPIKFTYRILYNDKSRLFRINVRYVKCLYWFFDFFLCFSSSWLENSFSIKIFFFCLYNLCSIECMFP